MILLDTSVLVPVVRDKSGREFERLVGELASADFATTRFTELELLQGAKSEFEWQRLVSFLDAQDLIDPTVETWRRAARCYFDLQRKGVTIGSPIDCCIAQIASDHDLPLLHNDRDFEAIASVCNLKHRRLDFSKA